MRDWTLKEHGSPSWALLLLAVLVLACGCGHDRSCPDLVRDICNRAAACSNGTRAWVMFNDPGPQTPIYGYSMADCPTRLAERCPGVTNGSSKFNLAACDLTKAYCSELEKALVIPQACMSSNVALGTGAG